MSSLLWYCWNLYEWQRAHCTMYIESIEFDSVPFHSNRIDNMQTIASWTVDTVLKSVCTVNRSQTAFFGTYAYEYDWNFVSILEERRELHEKFPINIYFDDKIRFIWGYCDNLKFHEICSIFMKSESCLCFFYRIKIQDWFMHSLEFLMIRSRVFPSVVVQ